MSHDGFTRGLEKPAPVEDSPTLGPPFVPHLRDLYPGLPRGNRQLKTL
jgi:hypothetical protein